MPEVPTVVKQAKLLQTPTEVPFGCRCASVSRAEGETTRCSCRGNRIQRITFSAQATASTSPEFPKKRSHLSFFCNLHITLQYRDLRSIQPSGNLASFRRNTCFYAPHSRRQTPPPFFLLPLYFHLSSCPDHTPSETRCPAQLSFYDSRAKSPPCSRRLQPAFARHW